ncbi:MAG: GGDEF domain-containing protein, partial [Pseudochelatococcus sp.]|uniref:GGDEF domain-containing protein n=1 Tax=Pseudochelatococcus sp. TaxID=2020869 RepID=UPI003D937A0D
MELDPLTLRTVAMAANLLLGVLLLSSWRNNRANRELLFLGVCFLGAAAGDFLSRYAADMGLPRLRDLGYTLLFLGYGAVWQAARLFGKRPISALAASAGGLVWLLCIPLAGGAALPWTRMAAITFVPVAYYLLAIAELYRGRREYMPSRLSLCVAMGIKCTVFLTYGALLFLHLLKGDLMVASAADDRWMAALRLVSIGANIAVAYLMLSLIKERLETEQRVQSMIDPLTGLGNRRALGNHAARILRRQAMSGAPVCVAIIDLDHFKQVNDTFGHLAGDDVLRTVAERATLSLRPNDSLFRIGGEEFLCILQSAREQDAVSAMERIRRDISGFRLGTGAEERAITISVGIASSTGTGYDLEDLTRAADSALYEAKRAGRNCVCVYASA